MGIKILDYRPYSKNTLQGFLSVLLPSGLEIRDLTLHRKNENRWIGMPGRPYEDGAGSVKYANIIYFPDKDRHRQFQDAVLKAFDEFSPKPQPQKPGFSDDEDIPF